MIAVGELVKSPFWYLFKPVNYVLKPVNYGVVCNRVGGETVWNFLKAGVIKEGRRNKDFKKEEQAGLKGEYLKNGGLQTMRPI